MKFSHELMTAAVRSSGRTIQWLSDASGVNRPMIYAYMNGESSPGSEALASLAKALDKPMEYFFCAESSEYRTPSTSGPAA